jgi:phage gp45-like
MRTTTTYAARQAQMNLSRATVREFDDKHLLQEVKAADVYHSETPTEFERFQMVGITAVPLKQEQSQQTQSSQSSGSDDGFNHNQPKGKAAEAIMLYPGGRSHPIALVDDRRVRPYAMKEGESAMYAASGTGQMLFHNDQGSYLVVVNNPAEQSQTRTDTERFASMRHVDKQKQSREIQQGGTIDDPHHEGETVNTEVRTTKTKIEIRDGDTVVAVYNKQDKSWTFSNFSKLNLQPSDEFNVTTKKIVMTATSDKFDINGKPINFNGGGPTTPPFTVPG